MTKSSTIEGVGDGRRETVAESGAREVCEGGLALGLRDQLLDLVVGCEWVSECSVCACVSACVCVKTCASECSSVRASWSGEMLERMPSTMHRSEMGLTRNEGQESAQ